MKHSLVRVIIAGAIGCCILTGCGPGQKDLSAFEARIKTLADNGTPDSLLSSARVYLSQIVSAKKSGNTSSVKSSYDSMKSYVTRAEQWYSTNTGSTKGYVDSLRAYFTEKKKALSGLQLKQVDSVVAIIEANVAKNWYIQARDFAASLDSLLPQLLKDEENSKKVLPLIAGTTWNMLKNDANCDQCKSVDRKKLTIKKDGTFELDEALKGQTSPVLKEDWQFLSSGSYSLKGDTILLNVKKEKCLRQVFWNLSEKNGKESWNKVDKPTYEKAITDNSKDQFMTYDYLKQNFKK